MRALRSSPALAALALFALPGCEEEKEEKAQTETEAESRDASAPDAPAPDAEPEQPAAAGSAERCELDGPPMRGECGAAAGPIARGPEGVLYLLDHRQALRRYQIQPGPGCRLALDTEFADFGVLAAPTFEPPSQRVDGPVYMRSGGADFHLTRAAGGTVYLYDFLGGIWRIEEGKARRVCADLVGVRSFALSPRGPAIVRGGELLGLRLRGGCRAGKPLPFEGVPKTPRLFADGEDLFVAGRRAGSHRVVRYRRGRREPLARLGADDAFAEGGLCSVTDVSACGDAICVGDGNCREIDRFDRSGRFLGETELRDLTGDRFYRLGGLAGGREGPLWIAVDLRVGDRESDECDGALYRWEP